MPEVSGIDYGMTEKQARQWVRFRWGEGVSVLTSTRKLAASNVSVGVVEVVLEAVRIVGIGVETAAPEDATIWAKAAMDIAANEPEHERAVHVMRSPDEKAVLTLDDFNRVMAAQDAVNMSGIVKDWGRLFDRIWNTARATGHGGTDWVNHHPLNVLMTSKCESLACEGAGDVKGFEVAYRFVLAVVNGGVSPTSDYPYLKGESS